MLRSILRAALPAVLPPEQPLAEPAKPQRMFSVFAQNEETTARFNLSAETSADALGEALELCPWAGIVMVKPEGAA